MLDRDINHLHDKLKPLCERFLADCKDAGLDVIITYTYRSPKEQDALYAQGRTKPGSIVTNAKAGQSKHNFNIAGVPASKAFDFVILDKGKAVWNTKDPRWAEAIAIGKKLGLESGADFKNLKDLAHFQLKE